MSVSDKASCSVIELPVKRSHFSSCSSRYRVKTDSSQNNPNTIYPCLCGCNTPTLLKQRFPNLATADPVSNFTHQLSAFLSLSESQSGWALKDRVHVQNSEFDYYHLFHTVIAVGKVCGKIKWKIVARVLGELHPDQQFVQQLRALYQERLAPFEKFIRNNGPVKLMLVNGAKQELCINILKEFLPPSNLTKIQLARRKKSRTQQQVKPYAKSPSQHSTDDSVKRNSDEEICKKIELSTTVEQDIMKISQAEINQDTTTNQILPCVSLLVRNGKDIIDQNQSREKIVTQEVKKKAILQDNLMKKFNLQLKAAIEPEDLSLPIMKKSKVREPEESRTCINESSFVSASNNSASPVIPCSESLRSPMQLQPLSIPDEFLNFSAPLSPLSSLRCDTETKCSSAAPSILSPKEKLEHPIISDSALVPTESQPGSESSQSQPRKRGRPTLLDQQQKLNEIKIPNLMNNEFRDQNPVEQGFKIDFKVGYLPIDMQAEEMKNDKLYEKISQESKTHFIKKQQSAMNIKRCCGVTYVVPSESKQIGVRDIYEPLAPLAFQVGTLERCRLSKEEEDAYLFQARNLISTMFQPNKYVRATFLSNANETIVKEYLLGKSYPEEEYLIEDIKELWRLLTDDTFLLLHFFADSEALLVPTPPKTRGTIFIGFSVRKSLCGTKSVKKSLGLERNEQDNKNMYATTIKLELYLTKQLWSKATKPTRNYLCAFISSMEGYINSLLNDWISRRDSMYIDKAVMPKLGILSWIKSCECSMPLYINEPGDKWNTEAPITYNSNSLTCGKCEAYLTEVNYHAANGLERVMNSKQAPKLFYLINTRDSFSYDLYVKKSHMNYNERKITKKEYYFHKDDLPSSYKDWEKYLEGDLVRVGITTYTNFFTPEEISALEARCRQVEAESFKGHFLPNTAQPTFGKGEKLLRTKFFFGARYLWTECQLAEKQSSIAGGVRVDVSAPPHWVWTDIERPLAEANILPKNFINSIAMNIYHDGTEGLGQHFDDAVRFRQPIYTVKLDSDARLSFGSQLYGFCNGAFTIPCPRGVICEMEEFSYAANKVKHCVRPHDLNGRSTTFILRQIHPFIMVTSI
jgi:hypothetical protein